MDPLKYENVATGTDVVCVETREISLRTVDFNRKSKLQWLLCNVDTNN